MLYWSYSGTNCGCFTGAWINNIWKFMHITAHIEKKIRKKEKTEWTKTRCSISNCNSSDILYRKIKTHNCQSSTSDMATIAENTWLFRCRKLRHLLAEYAICPPYILPYCTLWHHFADILTYLMELMVPDVIQKANFSTSWVRPIVHNHRKPTGFTKSFVPHSKALWKKETMGDKQKWSLWFVTVAKNGKGMWQCLA